jgi:putative transposase
MRAWPTSHQKQILSQWMGCARLIYNAKCEEQDYFFKFRCHSLSHTGAKIPLDQGYSQFKTDQSSFLKGCPSQILRNSSVIWYKSMQSFFKGLTQRPVRKKKGSRASIWVTRELFRLEKVEDTGKWRLFIGAERNNIGYLSFEAHREFLVPASLTISKNNGEYFVSFNYEDLKPNLKTQEELLLELSKKSKNELLKIAVGGDRGIVIPFQVSTGQSFDFSTEQKKTIEKKQRNIKKWQRRLTRQKLGSQRRNKVKREIAGAHGTIANVRKDFAHQTSRTLVGKKDKKGQVTENGIRIFAVEDLKIKNMTKSPEPKPDKQNPGLFVPNMAAAKAVLTQRILNSAWGKLVLFLSYKASQAGKVCIKVSPRFSSQECASCSHIHPDNRQTQSQFVCQKCGHTANADQNAAEVIKKRGVEEILKQVTRGMRESARGGTRKTPRALLKVQTRRSENRGRRRDDAELIPGSSGL